MDSFRTAAVQHLERTLRDLREEFADWDEDVQVAIKEIPRWCVEAFVLLLQWRQQHPDSTTPPPSLHEQIQSLFLARDMETREEELDVMSEAMATTEFMTIWNGVEVKHLDSPSCPSWEGGIRQELLPHLGFQTIDERKTENPVCFSGDWGEFDAAFEERAEEYFEMAEKSADTTRKAFDAAIERDRESARISNALALASMQGPKEVLNVITKTLKGCLTNSEDHHMFITWVQRHIDCLPVSTSQRLNLKQGVNDALSILKTAADVTSSELKESIN